MSTETLVILGAVAVFAVAPILAVRFMRALMFQYVDGLQKMQAQCDESRKVSGAQAEKAVNRALAMAYPNNYRSYRESSGVIEGAQQKVTPHFEVPHFEEEEVETPLLDRIERNGHGEEPKSRIVNSPSDYEGGEQP